MRPSPRWLGLALPLLLSGCPGAGEGAATPEPDAAAQPAPSPEPPADEPLDLEAIERAAREAAEAITPENADEELRRIEFELEVEDPGYETASGYRSGGIGDG